jgi:hypothetical protein
MGLPLRIGGEVIGALDIQSTVPDVFDEEDLATFSLLADQLAVAIYNARLLSQTEERVREVDRLNRQLTRTAWEGAEQYTDLKRGYRYNLLNVEPDEGETIRHNGEGGAVVSSPISIRGQVIGTLNAAPGEGQEFTEGDQVILRAVANRVALAIENARLFQETQFSLSETSALYQLSRNLNEANSLEDIIRAIIRSMITEASGGQIWIFDEHPPASGPQWMSLVTDVALAEARAERCRSERAAPASARSSLTARTAQRSDRADQRYPPGCPTRQRPAADLPSLAGASRRLDPADGARRVARHDHH